MQTAQIAKPQSSGWLQKLANEVPPQALCVLHKYGNAAQFLTDMSPAKQTLAAVHLDSVHRSEISITKVRLALGVDSANVWLMAQLENLNDFVNVSVKMNVSQMQELAGIIITEYGHFRAAEILVFFHRLKAGEYGQFYGSVDPLLVAAALNQYSKDRRVDIARIEADDNRKLLEAQREEWKKNAITREEWLKNKKEAGENAQK